MTSTRPPIWKSPAFGYVVKLILPVYVLLGVLIVKVGVDVTTVVSFLLSYVLVLQVSANFYHRYWAHRQVELSRGFEYVISFFGLFAMVGDPLSFSRIHRWHHAHADTELDLHSPIHGRFHSWFGWLFSGRKMHGVWVEDMLVPENKYLLLLAEHKIKLIWVTLAITALISMPVLVGFLMTMAVSFILEMSTNGYGHSAERREAVNRLVLPWFTLWPLHLDHHNDPRLIRKSDPGYLLLKVLAKLRLSHGGVWE